MPILFDNVVVLRVERPSDDGLGGDITNRVLVEGPIVADRQDLARGLSAGDQRERFDEVSVEEVSDATFFFDLKRSPSKIRELRTGDLVTWRYAEIDGVEAVGGGADGQDEVTRVKTWVHRASVVNHLEVLVKGTTIGQVAGA